MKKNSTLNISPGRKSVCAGLLVKVSLVLLLLAAQETVSGQRRPQRFTLTIRNAYLSELFLQIEKVSDYSFIYNVADIQALGKKNFNCQNVELRPILDRCLGGTPLKYEITDKHVVTSRRDGKVTEAPAATKKIVIEGQVTDIGREPLAGVTVRMRGTTKGVSTDANGSYRLALDVPENTDITLMFSFVGMETKSVKYTGQAKINVILKENESMMDEVVVQTGYQTLDKRKITSAVTTLKMKDINVPSLATVDLMLEGHVPGMVFMQNSATIGAAPRLRIRGTSTILGNQEPLWVVDGIVQTDPVNVDPNQLNDLDFVNLLGNAISGVNPEDIEQIDILKDASATAIYGARAANGVIVITTKKGNPGPPSVSYSFTGSFSRRPHYSDKYVNMMNSKERIDYSRELMENHQPYGLINSWVGYEGAMKDYYDGNIDYAELSRRISYYEGLNTDWFDILTQNSFTQKHTISLSGGSSTMRYYASLGLNNAQGNVKHEFNKTYTANINLTANYKRMSMRFGANASVQDRKYNPTEIDVLNYAYGTSRAIPAYDENGEPYSYFKYYSRNSSLSTWDIPFNIMNEMENSYNKSKIYTATITASLDYRIIDPLKFGLTLSYSMSNADQQKYYGDNTYYAQCLRYTKNGDSENLMPYGGELTQTKTDKHSYVIRGQFSFDKDLDKSGKHNISAALGGEISSTEYNNLNQIYRGYMPDRGMGMSKLDPARYTGYYDWYYTTPAARGVRSLELTNLVSGYATVSYDYDGRYMFNVNARADASNQFGSRANEKILPIWSISGRWNIKRDLMPHSKVVNSLSVRASLGLQGNMLSNQSSKLIITRDGEVNANNQYVAHVYSYPNPDLRWEKTTSTNVTVDFGLLDNKITGSLSYYYKKTKDAFLSKKVSTVNGVSSYVVNKGTVENQGIELGLNFVIINRQTKGNPEGFRWTMTPNLGQTLNRLLSKASSKTLKDAYTYSDFLNGSVEIPGKALNSFYSYKFTGLSHEDGRPTFYGLDEDEFLEKYKNMSMEDIYFTVMDYSGNRVPVFQGGFMNTFSYKRFTLGLNLTCSFGSKVRLLKMYPNVASGYGTIAPQPDKNARKEFINRWRNPGDEKYTNIPGTLSGSEFTNTLSSLTTWWMKDYPFAANIWQMYDNSDLRVVSGNYVRLQSLSLRYNLPSKITKKVAMKSAYVSFYATNLFTICSKDLKGQDPTTQSGSSETINMSNRPTYSFSLNVTF